MKKSITIQLDEDMLEKLRFMCSSHGLSLSCLIRLLLNKQLHLEDSYKCSDTFIKQQI